VTRPLLIACLALSALLIACGSDDGGGDTTATTPPRLEKLKVVSTVAPITSLVENIGGTKIELEGVVPEGVNSHTYEPPPSVVRTVADADLIIMNGLQLEEPTLELAEANKQADAQILLLGDSAIPPEEYKYDFSFPQSGGKPNPHLWPDPVLATEYASLIHDKLVEMDPANAEYYTTNLSKLNAQLERLDQQIRIAVQTIPEANRKLLTYHDSWAYWADNYDVEVVGAIQQSDFSEPSASELIALIETVRAEKLAAIFDSELPHGNVVEGIAAETGALNGGILRDDDLPGEPGGDAHSYLGLMKQNMEIMIPALGGDAASIGLVNPALVFDDGESTAKYPQ
jgi:ABC-type Zn uptake system ZnuABC Zn-binding protein ZnuA